MRKLRKYQQAFIKVFLSYLQTLRTMCCIYICTYPFQDVQLMRLAVVMQVLSFSLRNVCTTALDTYNL